uniref:Uncharacterized protein n=1 Tax=Arion vulgaris TaxID=1028688 RepID=A0A0B7BJA9_9EUPU
MGTDHRMVVIDRKDKINSNIRKKKPSIETIKWKELENAKKGNNFKERIQQKL